MRYAILSLVFMPKIAYLLLYLERWKPQDTQQLPLCSEMESGVDWDDRLRVGIGHLRVDRGGLWEGTTRAEDAQGTPTQSRISPSILVYED